MTPNHSKSDGTVMKKRLWLLLLFALPAAGLFWKEYPALIRYIKLERM